MSSPILAMSKHLNSFFTSRKKEDYTGGVGVYCTAGPVPRYHMVKQKVPVPVQENFSKGGRAGIFDLYPVVLYLFVRCFLILFGGRFGRVSRGTLPILTTIHAVLIKLHHEYVLLRRFFFYFDWDLTAIKPPHGLIRRPGTAQLL